LKFGGEFVFRTVVIGCYYGYDAELIFEIQVICMYGWVRFCLEAVVS
jgi:hypothetical protein